MTSQHITKIVKLSELLDYSYEDARLQFHSNGIFELSHVEKRFVDLLNKLKNGMSKTEYNKIINRDKKIRAFAKLLEQKNWLVETLNDCTPVFPEPYRKTLGYLEYFVKKPIASFRKLQNSLVVLIGVGGTGTVILENLAASGITRFILVDHDKVELNNFNRQYIFSQKQQGMAKVDAAKEYVMERFPFAKIQTFQKKITDFRSLKFLDGYSGISLIIGAADEPKSINLILSEYSWKRKIAFISGSVGIENGVWGPFIIPEKTQRYFKVMQMENEPKTRGFNKGLFKILRNKKLEWSFGPSNALIGTFIARDTLLYLLGSKKIPSLGKRLHFDWDHLAVTCINGA